MFTIKKQELNPYTGQTTITLPINIHIRYLGFQGSRLFIWYEEHDRCTDCGGDCDVGDFQTLPYRVINDGITLTLEEGWQYLHSAIEPATQEIHHVYFYKEPEPDPLEQILNQIQAAQSTKQ